METVKWETENDNETFQGEIVQAVVSPFSQFYDCGEYKLELKISKDGGKVIPMHRHGEKDRLKRFVEIIDTFNCLNEDEMGDAISILQDLSWNR
jgi:hypothetical protein